jgi:large subunit ribosomal protein L15
MQLHQLKATKNQKTKKRVGRGGKRGTFSGRGVKGQKARAGRKLRPEWRDTLKRIPKRRGYKFKSGKTKPAILNLANLEGIFKDGELVTPEILVQKHLVVKSKGRVPQIKILGDGEIKIKLDFKQLNFSQNAREKIEKAGGSIREKLKVRSEK